MGTNLDNVHFVILGIKSNFRGGNLARRIKDDGFYCEIAWGSSQLIAQREKERERHRIYFGRDLTSGEVLCAEGHRKILTQIGSREASWLVVLEDDAVVDSTFQLVEQLNGLSDKLPVIMSFFSQKKNCLTSNLLLPSLPFKEKSSALRCYSIPTSTVGYAINRAGLRILQSERFKKDKYWVGFQADFPPFFGDIFRFYIHKGELVKHGTGAGVIGNRGQNISFSKKLCWRLFLRRWAIFSFAYFFVSGRRYSGLKGYAKFFHGRLLAQKLYELRNKAR